MTKLYDSIPYTGNIINPVWFKTIVSDKGRPSLVAMNLLADIVYWHTMKTTRDSSTGKVLLKEKRFESDKLQKSYNSYCDLFGVSRSTIIRAFTLLEKLGVITREFRNIKTKTGLSLHNVMYITLNNEGFCKISELSGVSKGHHPHVKMTLPPCQNDTTPMSKGHYPHVKIGGTYTETTTETTIYNYHATNKVGSPTEKKLSSTEQDEHKSKAPPKVPPLPPQKGDPTKEHAEKQVLQFLKAQQKNMPSMVIHYKKNPEQYKAKQIKAYTRIWRDLNAIYKNPYGVDAILQFIIQDSFRNKQIGSIEKLRKKHKSGDGKVYYQFLDKIERKYLNEVKTRPVITQEMFEKARAEHEAKLKKGFTLKDIYQGQ